MRLSLPFLCAPFVALAACEPVSTQPVEYRPEEAGTVDHALCLLGYTGVAMREVVTGHQLVDVTLNGRAAHFVVDTGANVSVLHAPLAQRFGITAGRSGSAGAIGIGGGTQAQQARIENLRIGEVPVRQQRIVLTDLSQLTSVLGPLSGETISGIIGQDILMEHRAVIDVSRSMLHLIVGDQDPGPVPAGRCEAQGEPVEAGNVSRQTDSGHGPAGRRR